MPGASSPFFAPLTAAEIRRGRFLCRGGFRRSGGGHRRALRLVASRRRGLLARQEDIAAGAERGHDDGNCDPRHRGHSGRREGLVLGRSRVVDLVAGRRDHHGAVGPGPPVSSRLCPSQFGFDALDRGFKLGFFGCNLGERRLRPQAVHPRRQHLPRPIVNVAPPLRIPRAGRSHRTQQDRIIIDHWATVSYTATLAKNSKTRALVASSLCRSTGMSQYSESGKHSSR